MDAVDADPDEPEPGVAEPGVAYEATPLAGAPRVRRRRGRGAVVKDAGGGGAGEMDAWQQSVETRLTALGSKIDSQTKWLLGAYAAGFVLLGGLIINRTDATYDRLSAKIEALDAKLSAKIDTVGAQVADLKTDVAVLKAKPQRP